MPSVLVFGYLGVPFGVLGNCFSYFVYCKGIILAHSTRYSNNFEKINRDKEYSLDEAVELLSSCKRTILIENNYSGLFHRYMRGETGFTVDGHIRKYDGEPFKPHHIVAAVQEQLEGDETLSVPYEEIIV